MTAWSTDRERELLRELLGPDSRLLPFAEAVVRHLNQVQQDETAAEMVAHKVAEILRPATANEDPVAWLREWPELLASFFQNADLLPLREPEATEVARLVMTAIESLDAQSE